MSQLFRIVYTEEGSTEKRELRLFQGDRWDAQLEVDKLEAAAFLESMTNRAKPLKTYKFEEVVVTKRGL